MGKERKAFSIVTDLQLSTAAVDELPLPEGTYNTVYVQARVLKFDERARKGWAISEDLLGDGWKTLIGGHVNLGHDASELWGHVSEAVKTEDGLYANLAISRNKLEREDKDPERIPKDYKVSAEWTFNGLESKVTNAEGDEFSVEDALAQGLLVEKETLPGHTELIAGNDAATLWCVGTEIHDLALVDLKRNAPAFQSAEILQASAAIEALQETVSIERYLNRIAVALEKKVGSDDGRGPYPYIRATFTNTVVYDFDGGLYRRNYSVVAGGDVEFEEAEEVEQAYVVKATDGGLYLKGHIPEGIEEANPEARMEFMKNLITTSSVPKKKEGGSNSPPKGYPTSRNAYADPTNYAYPISTERKVRNTVQRFDYAIGEYSRGELVFMARRIAKAAELFGVEIQAKSLIAKYLGLDNANSISEKGGEVETMADGDKLTFTQDELDALIEGKVTEAKETALAEALSEDSDVRKQFVAEYEEKTLPGKIEEAVAAERKRIEEQTSAVATLNAIHPLSDEEKEAHLQAMSEGKFSLDLETALRENRKLKGEFESDGDGDNEEESDAGNTVEAMASTSTPNSGLSAGAGDSEESDTDGEPEEVRII
jgi:hypothetical protein